MADCHSDLFKWCIISGWRRSGGAQEYVRQGKEIPDFLLPGRALMNMSESERAKYAQTNWSNTSPWWIKHIVEMSPGTPANQMTCMPPLPNGPKGRIRGRHGIK